MSKRCKECWVLNQNPLLKYCIGHANMNKGIKSSQVKKISSKRKKRLSGYSEKDMFKDIWNERPHICVDCNRYLQEAKAHNFSHIKSKWSRPDLRMDKDNIEILCFRCHFKKDHWLDYKWPNLD